MVKAAANYTLQSTDTPCNWEKVLATGNKKPCIPRLSPGVLHELGRAPDFPYVKPRRLRLCRAPAVDGMAAVHAGVSQRRPCNTQLRPHLAALAAKADTLVMAYPNAGLPNELGEYDEAAAETAAQVSEWIDSGLVNIVGGCCGTTAEHIAAIASATSGRPPRPIPQAPKQTLLAGLEPMVLAA